MIRMPLKIRATTAALCLLFALPAAAEQIAPEARHDSGAMDHGAHMRQAGDPVAAPTSTPTPLEPGQGAFAAIAEIVVLLEADPATDWSRVDIAALRRHLIDMNAVTLDTDVVVEATETGARFTVSGEGRVLEAARRMVIAHAATMNGRSDWTFDARETPSGVLLSVSGGTQADAIKIRALGFIGVMTRGAHHQEHHLLIASGQSAHD